MTDKFLLRSGLRYTVIPLRLPFSAAVSGKGENYAHVPLRGEGNMGVLAV